MQFGTLTFLNPYALYMLPFAIIFILLIYYLSTKKSAIGVFFLQDLKKIGFGNSIHSYIKISLLILILSLYFILFANPNKIQVEQSISKEGIDIVLALDISGSMEEKDIRPNRIEAAKSVIFDFIQEIKSDRVGLVVFAGKPFSSVPLTYDYNILSEIITEISTESLNQRVIGLDGTAIGDAILLSKNLLTAKEEGEDTIREKIIILLTDGNASRGVDPILATKSILDTHIKIYSIGIGTHNTEYPLDETTLKNIAQMSNAQFFRAYDNHSLEYIFDEISRLEKTKIDIDIQKTFSTEYTPFLYTLIILLIGLFTYTIYLKQ